MLSERTAVRHELRRTPCQNVFLYQLPVDASVVVGSYGRQPETALHRNVDFDKMRSNQETSHEILRT
jgi:hypothetical protein